MIVNYYLKLFQCFYQGGSPLLGLGYLDRGNQIRPFNPSVRAQYID